MSEKNFYDKMAAKHNARPKNLIFNEALANILNSPVEKNFYALYDMEREVLGQIKEGNIEATENLFNREFTNSLKKAETLFSEDHLKQLEYITVTSIVLYSRAAIEGGASLQTVYALQDFLLHKLSKSSQIQEYYNLNYEAVLAFTNIVKSSKGMVSGSKRVERMKKYIQRNLGNSLSVHSMAENFNMSSDHLSRLFFDDTGIMVRDYIRQERIHAACELLKYSDYSLSEISLIVGFSSQSYFGKVFKTGIGMTPMQYRVRNKSDV